VSDLPNAERCKVNAIGALARVADLDPEITGEPRDEAATTMLIAIAQVWATLATIPKERW
jgi:hypothetical protein